MEVSTVPLTHYMHTHIQTCVFVFTGEGENIQVLFAQLPPPSPAPPKWRPGGEPPPQPSASRRSATPGGGGAQRAPFVAMCAAAWVSAALPCVCV